MAKCNNCNKPATFHLTEIKGGKTIEIDLCEQCHRASEGLQISSKTHQPINELLENFVMLHSGTQGALSREQGQACEQCGITWAEFRQTGLLGCEQDYTRFEKDLMPLLQRAHEGATHHVGKSPARRGAGNPPIKKQTELARLRKELARAVEAEDYERAASLRDQMRQIESAG